MSVNVVIFEGRLGKDPVLENVGSTQKMTLRLAQTKRTTVNGETKEKTVWMTADVWGKTAVNTVEHLHKGDSLTVVGRLDVDEYEKDGVKKSITRIVVSSLEFGSRSKPTTTENPTLSETDVSTVYENITRLMDAGVGKTEAVSAVTRKLAARG